VYSAEPFQLDRTRKYAQEIDAKPSGLWLSAGDDWARWKTEEEHEVESLRHKARVTLVDEVNVLWVRGEAELRRFTREWTAYDPTDEDGGLLVATGLPRTTSNGGLEWIHNYRIAWPSVADEYDGIVIAPYVWECRLGPATAWYYGWDCASGCVWNLEVIDEVEVAKEDVSYSCDGTNFRR
jgi:hypothetical protein